MKYMFETKLANKCQKLSRGSMAGPGWTRRRLKQGKSDYTSFRDPRVVFTRWDLSGYISDGGNAQRGMYI